MTIQQELDAAAKLRRRVLERAQGERSRGSETRGTEIRGGGSREQGSAASNARLEGVHAKLIRQRLEGTPPPTPPSADRSSSEDDLSERRFPRSLLAAAASILVFTGLWQAGVFESTKPVFMNPGDIEILSPRGAMEEIGEFRWRHEQGLTPGGYYRIVVEPTEGPLFESRQDLTDLTWSPPAEVAASWSEFSWTVIAFRASGERDTTSGEPVHVKVKSP